MCVHFEYIFSLNEEDYAKLLKRNVPFREVILRFASLKMILSAHNVQLVENFHHILNVFYCKKIFLPSFISISTTLRKHIFLFEDL